MDEEKLRQLTNDYLDNILMMEEMSQWAGTHAVTFYTFDRRRRDLHDQIADLAGVDRSSLYDILSSAVFPKFDGDKYTHYETEEDFYIAVSDEIARIKRRENN
jgi:DNA-binding phage protein